MLVVTCAHAGRMQTCWAIIWHQQGRHLIRFRTSPYAPAGSGLELHPGTLTGPCALAGRTGSCWAASWRPPQSRSTRRLQLPGPGRPPEARPATTAPATSSGAPSASTSGSGSRSAPSNARGVSWAGPLQYLWMLSGGSCVAGGPLPHEDFCQPASRFCRVPHAPQLRLCSPVPLPW